MFKRNFKPYISSFKRTKGFLLTKATLYYRITLSKWGKDWCYYLCFSRLDLESNSNGTFVNILQS